MAELRGSLHRHLVVLVQCDGATKAHDKQPD